MPDETKLIYCRVSPEEAAKLERMRKGSGRPSIQNVIEVLIALADESAPEWHIVPQEAPNAADPVAESR